MKRTFAALFALIVLAGCSTFSIPNPVSDTRFASIESTYGVALSAAANYRDLYRTNRCTTSRPESIANICARRSVVKQMQVADQQAQVALGQARAFHTANPTLDATSFLDAAERAVNTFLSISTQSRGP